MTNQHLNDSVLFQSQGTPITELEPRNKERLVLYTENIQVFKQFRHWKQLLFLVPYLKDKDLIAADLYFPKSAKKELLRVLNRDYK